MLNWNVTIPLPAKRINYILFSETADHNLAQKLGCAEYSYFFVREAFRALLEPHSNYRRGNKPGKGG